MQWEGQSRFLTVCPMRLFQLIFTIRAIECQEKVVSRFQEVRFSKHLSSPSKQRASQPCKRPGLCAQLPPCLDLHPTANKHGHMQTITIIFSMHLSFNKDCYWVCGQKPSYPVLSFHWLFVFRQSSVSEVGSRSLKENNKEKVSESFSPLLHCSKYAEGHLLHSYYQPVNILPPSPLN